MTLSAKLHDDIRALADAYAEGDLADDLVNAITALVERASNGATNDQEAKTEGEAQGS